MQDFEKYQDVDEELIKKYKDDLPEDILTIWKDYGFGSFYNGFLKVINPLDYSEFVEKTFFRKDSIPIMTTGTGEIIAWVANEFIYMLDYVENDFENLACTFEFFWEDLDNKIIEFLCNKAQNYKKLVNERGRLEYKECFVMEKKIIGEKIDTFEYVNKLVELYGNI